MAVWMHLGGHHARVDLDGGATKSTISDRFVMQHKLNVHKFKRPVKLNLVVQGSTATVKAYVNVPVSTNGEFLGYLVLPIMALDGWDAPIGSDIMVQYKMIQNWEEMKVTYWSPLEGHAEVPTASTMDSVTAFGMLSPATVKVAIAPP